ncbi:MAG TPA: DUF4256 domain-containing protein [Brevefilum sp.]|nr:DUF4256 domain-containing protein [Brevefilum sp.]HOR19275.1 DUF4256 domain-containing protein [Brevefilum sp.]HPL69880.1 DUF4256 domain-containing protein [Brevefilum sp.]
MFGWKNFLSQLDSARSTGKYAHRRYGQVFVYHNGADSYYSSRGFRGVLRV